MQKTQKNSKTNSKNNHTNHFQLFNIFRQVVVKFSMSVKYDLIVSKSNNVIFTYITMLS